VAFLFNWGDIAVTDQPDTEADSKAQETQTPYSEPILCSAMMYLLRMPALFWHYWDIWILARNHRAKKAAMGFI